MTESSPQFYAEIEKGIINMAENKVNPAAENNAENFNDLVRVRREKLKNLQDAGQDPFQITKYDVTHRGRTYDVQENHG